MNTALISVTRLSLSGLSNEVLAAANNALTGFGSISQENMAYAAFRDFDLIQENGRPQDTESLLEALSLEIDTRLENASFF